MPLFQLHLLYMNMDQSLHDCSDIVSGDSANTEMVQDYKKLSRKVCHKSLPRPRQDRRGPADYSLVRHRTTDCAEGLRSYPACSLF